MTIFSLLTSLVLLNADFPIANLGTDEVYPCVTYAHNQYYVFWTDLRTSPFYSLYGARVCTSGTVIDPNGKLLLKDSVFTPRVAFDGTNFLVVWCEGC